MAEPGLRAFVCGQPIAHSRSPMIHRHWLSQYAIDGSYDPIEVAPADFSGFVSSLAENGLAGGNVTIPNKEAAFAAVDRRDGEAGAVGAVNTLWFDKGRLVGGNTDALGFAANLDAFAPQWRDRGRSIDDVDAVEAGLQDGVHDRPRRAAGADDQRPAAIAPLRRKGV